MSSTRRTALIFGVLFLATFVFSIGGVILYDPVLHPADFIAGTGGDTRVRLGVFCEVLRFVANVGTTVVNGGKRGRGFSYRDPPRCRHVSTGASKSSPANGSSSATA